MISDALASPLTSSMSSGVVASLYPGSSSLRDHLRAVLPVHACEALERHDDPLSYRRMLGDTRVVPDGHPFVGSVSEISESCGKHRINDVINRAIPALLRQKDSNCLVSGYRQKAVHSEALMRNSMNTECYFVNTIHTLFFSSQWQLLVDRVGERVFRYLLTKKMFIKAENGSYLQVCGPITMELGSLKPVDLPGYRSAVVRGGSMISRHPMLYNTRREGEAGLPKTSCFFKKTSEEIIAEIFGDRLQKPFLAATLLPALGPWMSRMVDRYFEYDVRGAAKLFLIANAGQDPTKSAPVIDDTPAKKKRRGCRAGQHVHAHKKQRSAQTLFRGNGTETTAGEEGKEKDVAVGTTGIVPRFVPLHGSAVKPLTTIGDHLMEGWLGRLSVLANDLCSQSLIATQTQTQTQTQTSFAPNSVAGGGGSSRSQRKRMKRKLNTLLKSRNRLVLSESDAEDVLPDPPSPSAGLQHHVTRSHMTFPRHGHDQGHGQGKGDDKPALSASRKQEVWEKACHPTCVLNLVKSLCRHVFSLEEVWGSRHNLDVFLQTVDIYLTQSRHETLSVEQLCKGISTTAMPWLQQWSVLAEARGVTDAATHASPLLRCWVHFVFNEFINSVVGNTFYVTEVEGKGMQLFYFRKPTWFNIVRDHMADFKSQFVPVCLADSDATITKAAAAALGGASSPQKTLATCSSPLPSRANSLPTSPVPQMPQLPRYHPPAPVTVPAPASLTEPPISVLFNSLLPAASGGRLARTTTPSILTPMHTLPLAPFPGAKNPTSAPIKALAHALADGLAPQTRCLTQLALPMPPALGPQLIGGLQRTRSAPAASRPILPASTAGLKSGTKPGVKPALNVPVVRFVPKKHTVRAIANLRSRHALSPATAKSEVVTNNMLYNCLHVLKAIYDQVPDLGGCGVFGADEIYRKLRAFKDRADRSFPDHSPDSDKPRFFVAMLDVEKCYDHVCTHTVYDIVQHILRHFVASAEALAQAEDGKTSAQVYAGIKGSSAGVCAYDKDKDKAPSSSSSAPSNPIIIHKYFITHAQQKGASARTTSSGLGVFSKPLRLVSLRGDLLSFPEAGPVLAQQYPQSIIADQVVYSQVSPDEVLRLLRCHLFGHVVRMPLPYKHPDASGRGSSYYSQIKGIPQGSVLSALLCTFYYGFIEHKVFGLHRHAYGGPAAPAVDSQDDEAPRDPLGLESGESVVIRCMDDYLIVSLRPRYVETFLASVFSTFRSEYGIRVSMPKVKVSFPVSVACQGDVLQFEPSPSSTLSWCGWLIDHGQRGLQVRPDFQRIVKLTASISSIPQLRQLRRAMCNWIRMKCHALVLDTRCLNSKASVMESVFQIFAVAAYRMAASLDKLVSHHRRYVAFADVYVIRCIRESVVYGAKLIHARRHSRRWSQGVSKTRALYQQMHRAIAGDCGESPDEDTDDGDGDGDDAGSCSVRSPREWPGQGVQQTSHPQPSTSAGEPTADGPVGPQGRVDDFPIKEVLAVAWSAFLRVAELAGKACVLRRRSLRVWMERRREKQLQIAALSADDQSVLQTLLASPFLVE